MTENNANETKAPEINVDGVVYSPELKKGYDEAFLTRVEIGDRKGIQCTASLSQQLKRIVNILGYGRTTIGSYVQNILECHLAMHKVVINELKVASLLSDNDETAMDKISLAAKKYQAFYLTGDDTNRSRKKLYVSKDLVDRIHKIIKDVDGGKPTVGSYAECIIRQHLDMCGDVIAEMTNDKCRTDS